MQITIAGEYAIRAMLFLAEQPFGKIFQTSQIALEAEIPKPFLRKILSILTKAELVESTRGIGGGIKLTKSATEINLLEIVEAIDGKILFNKCFFEPNFCHRTNWCSVHAVWSEAQNLVQNLLQSKTLYNLVLLNKTKKSCLNSKTLINTLDNI
ncbi:MAG: Rrf2 family transcriptional regulator [bacterium]